MDEQQLRAQLNRLTTDQLRELVAKIERLKQRLPQPTIVISK